MANNHSITNLRQIEALRLYSWRLHSDLHKYGGIFRKILAYIEEDLISLQHKEKHYKPAEGRLILYFYHLFWIFELNRFVEDLSFLHRNIAQIVPTLKTPEIEKVELSIKRVFKALSKINEHCQRTLLLYKHELEKQSKDLLFSHVSLKGCLTLLSPYLPQRVRKISFYYGYFIEKFQKLGNWLVPDSSSLDELFAKFQIKLPSKI